MPSDFHIDDVHLDLHDCSQCQAYWDEMEATEDAEGFIDISDEKSAEIKKHVMEAHPELQGP